MTETRRFPNSPSSVTQARRYVRAQLGGAPPDLVDAVLVMTSELATNSIRHAATDFEIAVDRTPRTLRVAVTDGRSGVPTVLSPDPTQTSGRGLKIVAKLADDWGVTATGANSKTVWFSVALPTRSERPVSSPGC
jgi:anti-sigma regulatory factor (Ser/Thr protein kinase)